MLSAFGVKPEGLIAPIGGGLVCRGISGGCNGLPSKASQAGLEFVRN